MIEIIAINEIYEMDLIDWTRLSGMSIAIDEK